MNTAIPSIRKITLACCISFIWTATSGADVTVNFESEGDWQANFQSVGTAEPGWNAREGIGGSACLLANSTGFIAGVGSEALDVKVGNTISISTCFRYLGQSKRISERNAGVFLTASPSASPLDAREGGILSVYFYNVSNEGTTRLGFSSSGAPSMSDKGTLEDNPAWWDSAAVPGHWYQLKVTFTKLPAPDLWEVSAKVFDLGNHGDATPQEIHSFLIPELTAKELYEAESIYAGFQNLRNNRGFRAMDQFEVAVK